MKNSEALNNIKLAIELQDSLGVASFRNIIQSSKNFIDDTQILSEIERKNWGTVLLLIDSALFKQTKFKPYFFLSDLDAFDFEEQEGLTIDDIKQLLEIELLQFCTVKDSLGNVTSYCQHWENQRRICIAAERDLLYKINQDKSLSLILYKKAIKANLGYYYRFTIKEYFEPVYHDYNDDYEHEYGPKGYGYDSWDDMAFNEAFEGDEDAWRHYNQ